MRTRDERWSAKLGPFKNVEDRNDAVIYAYLHGGVTMQAIAEVMGMTRQRVQQIVARVNAEDRRKRLPPERWKAVINNVRHTNAHSYYALARGLGLNIKFVKRCIVKMGKQTAVERLFAWRKRKVRDSRLTTLVHTYIEARINNGGTPLTIDQMMNVGIFPTTLSKLLGPKYITKFRTLVGESPRKRPVKASGNG